MNAFIYSIVGTAIAILAFMALRGFWTWYWKITQIVELLAGMREDLRALNGQLARQSVHSAPTLSSVQPIADPINVTLTVPCGRCGKRTVQVINGRKKCTSCEFVQEESAHA
jgi:hypothetical protein